MATGQAAGAPLNGADRFLNGTGPLSTTMHPQGG